MDEIKGLILIFAIGIIGVVIDKLIDYYSNE